jgi:1A family penicillin-binding protein
MDMKTKTKRRHPSHEAEEHHPKPGIGRNWTFYIKKLLLVFFCVSFFAAVGAVSILAYFYFYKTPKAKELPGRMSNYTTVIYDRTGEHVLYEIHGEENRKTLTHGQIPESIRIATIAAEDSSFYRHHGIDIPSLIRALEIDLRSGQFQQGGSTITQQLARNVYFDRSKTFERKFMEIIMAVKIERKFTKDEILDFYLNQIPYGSNAYGIESASETFFGKNAAQLSLDEAALLAALPKATTFYSPYGNHRTDLAARQKMILERIGELGLAEKKSVAVAISEDTLKKILPPRTDVKAPHFVFYIKELLEKEYGAEFLETAGLKIYTTLDFDMQERAEESIREGISRNMKYNAGNASLVAVDPKTGEVLAMVGSRDFFDVSVDGQVNVAVSPRQPGSSFKPFAYAKAFEKGYQPETMLYDVRTNFGPDGTGKDYIPADYDGQTRGIVSMRQALSMSLNIPAVETLYLAGIDGTIDLAHRLGITTLRDRNRYGLSLVLGGGEVKLLDMVSAFSVFANDGIKNRETVIRKIVDQKGKIIMEQIAAGERVLNRDITAKINSILSDNAARSPVFGSSSPLAFKNQTVAAKTGTTQEFRDAWTVGYTPRLAAGVWVGNSDNTAMKAGSDGIYVAAPIWRSFMDKELANFPEEQFMPYQKISSDKPLLTGSVPGEVQYFKIASGKKISGNKAEKYKASQVRKILEPERHSILFYVNKDDPLGSGQPDFKDPMLARWEESLKDDFENAFSIEISGIDNAKN